MPFSSLPRSWAFSQPLLRHLALLFSVSLFFIRDRYRTSPFPSVLSSDASPLFASPTTPSPDFPIHSPVPSFPPIFTNHSSTSSSLPGSSALPSVAFSSVSRDLVSRQRLLTTKPSHAQLYQGTGFSSSFSMRGHPISKGYPKRKQASPQMSTNVASGKIQTPWGFANPSQGNFSQSPFLAAASSSTVGRANISTPPWIWQKSSGGDEMKSRAYPSPFQSTHSSGTQNPALHKPLALPWGTSTSFSSFSAQQEGNESYPSSVNEKPFWDSGGSETVLQKETIEKSPTLEEIYSAQPYPPPTHGAHYAEVNIGERDVVQKDPFSESTYEIPAGTGSLYTSHSTAYPFSFVPEVPSNRSSLQPFFPSHTSSFEYDSPTMGTRTSSATSSILLSHHTGNTQDEGEMDPHVLESTFQPLGPQPGLIKDPAIASSSFLFEKVNIQNRSPLRATAFSSPPFSSPQRLVGKLTSPPLTSETIRKSTPGKGNLQETEHPNLEKVERPEPRRETAQHYLERKKDARGTTEPTTEPSLFEKQQKNTNFTPNFTNPTANLRKSPPFPPSTATFTNPTANLPQSPPFAPSTAKLAHLTANLSHPTANPTPPAPTLPSPTPPNTPVIPLGLTLHIAAPSTPPSPILRPLSPLPSTFYSSLHSMNATNPKSPKIRPGPQDIGEWNLLRDDYAVKPSDWLDRSADGTCSARPRRLSVCHMENPLQLRITLCESVRRYYGLLLHTWIRAARDWRCASLELPEIGPERLVWLDCEADPMVVREGPPKVFDRLLMPKAHERLFFEHFIRYLPEETAGVLERHFAQAPLVAVQEYDRRLEVRLGYLYAEWTGGRSQMIFTFLNTHTEAFFKLLFWFCLGICIYLT